LYPLPELISNLHWLLSNPIDLKGLRGDMWAWASVPNIKEVLHELLSLLERHNVALTFFISGVCAEQNKDEIVRIKDAGHEIGLHGYRHVPYDMLCAEMVRDMYQAISVFREMGVVVKGFRAPWLIANKDAYRAAQMLGLTYVSNVSAKKALQRVDKYNLVELPIYLDDQTLLQKNAVEILLESSETGRVFEFHLLYVRQRMRVLDDFLNKLKIDTATLSQIAGGSKGVGLSFDIAYLNRLELLKKLFS
jgi:peptidoglycan/xylan/chitin deacetylase (PgdA/CDA1 family)